jgi:hypothetical protein
MAKSVLIAEAMARTAASAIEAGVKPNCDLTRDAITAVNPFSQEGHLYRRGRWAARHFRGETSGDDVLDE